MIEQKRGQLEIRVILMKKLFNELQSTNSRSDKECIVSYFKQKHPKMEKDLNYCFEVLAGKHKLGYTYGSSGSWGLSDAYEQYENCTIRGFIEKVLKARGATEFEVAEAYVQTPPSCRVFIENLVNRKYKLGYSNKAAMVTSLSPMLAKKYPETFREGYYYVQEKLDGNRCVATYIEAGEMSPEGIRSLKGATEGKWFFYSRSGKPLKVNFDMSWADKSLIYDGEVMTLGRAGSRDFNATSGAINGKYTDKSSLHYFIYDIVADNYTYEERWAMLRAYGQDRDDDWDGRVSTDCTILKVLDKVWVWPNTDYNGTLDKWLDYIVDKGGEGVILRDPDAMYEHKRCNGLLKYKKTQTMDLRITGWNEGKGKYEGAIGSFRCETDDGSIVVNVAGMSDEVRFSDPTIWLGKIIEVAYFDSSQSKNKSVASLRFPRLKRVRNDKDTTSIY